MLRFFVWSSCLLLLACGGGQVAKTTSVTDGGLVMGIVPLKNGDEGDYRRYRLLLCKKLPEYNAQVFADTSKCRSALHTQDGKEVDLVGKSLSTAEAADIASLDAENAGDSKLIGNSPMTYLFFNPHKVQFPIRGWAALTMFFPPVLIYALIKHDKDRKKAHHTMLERFGDDSKRVLPRPAVRGTAFTPAVYARTDLMTSRNWYNIYAKDFQDITSLEKRGDLRAILVAMAKFYKLKVNESALQLETL